MKQRLYNGLLVTADGILRQDLLLEDGKIAAILAPEVPDSPDCQRIDCKGYYISPGFVDIHQHGGGGSDYMDDDPQAYLNATEAHLAHGTTSVMPTLLSADQTAWCLVSRMVELDKQFGVISVQGLGQAADLTDDMGVCHAELVRCTDTCLVVDAGDFRNDQSGTAAGAIGIVFDHARAGFTGHFSQRTSHCRHDNAVADFQVGNLTRSE